MYFMQQRKTEIALTGNASFEADNWISRLMISAYEVADQIMVDSAEDNALRAHYTPFDEYGASIPQAELMSSRYGSFGPRVGVSPRTAQCSPYAKILKRSELPLDEKGEERAKKEGPLASDRTRGLSDPKKTPSEEELLVGSVATHHNISLIKLTNVLTTTTPQEREATGSKSDRYRLPGATDHRSCIRRIAGRLGLDFVVAGIKFANRQLGKCLRG